MKNSILIRCVEIEYNGDREKRWYTPRIFIDHILLINPNETKNIEELIRVNRKSFLEKVIKECRHYRPCHSFELIKSKWIIKTDINDEITTTHRIYMESGS